MDIVDDIRAFVKHEANAFFIAFRRSRLKNWTLGLSDAKNCLRMAITALNGVGGITEWVCMSADGQLFRH